VAGIVETIRGRLIDVVTVDESPVAQDLYSESQARANQGLSRREVAAEALVGGGFAAAAGALFAVGVTQRALSPLALVLLLGAFAVFSRVEFDVGRFYTVPSQVIFVPMLLLLPPGIVPLCVVAGLTLAKLPDRIKGGKPLSRLLLSFSDAWFAIGPAAILIAAGAPKPTEITLPLALACIGAQFTSDFVGSAMRVFIIGDGPVRGEMEAHAWIYIVDLLLWPVGVITALAAQEQVWAIALVVSLGILLRLFSFERRSRLDQLGALSTAYRGTAVLLGDVVEADHAYTGEHSKGVVELSVAVARQLKLNPVRQQRVEFAALLHDVGKIAIPKEIIDKPGKLDEREWEVMKTHTIAGERMLQQVGGLLADVGQIVRSSHEHFDGSGYPDGLAGQAIPCESRIVSACDAFSAMTTDRSYRAARSSSEALQELKDCAFTQFDPEVVLALVTVIERRTAEAHDDAAALPAPPWSDVVLDAL
jgi:putative nucleotidyltransferase with HDIG domain